MLWKLKKKKIEKYLNYKKEPKRKGNEKKELLTLVVYTFLKLLPLDKTFFNVWQLFTLFEKFRLPLETEDVLQWFVVKL